jgi:ABC-type polysaccharide/polyol phosphate export permease
MINILTKKQQHWLDFLFAMTEREIKVRYKHAVLGFLWIILNPLLQMLIIGIIFSFFVPIKTENYFLFLFVGLLPWNFFSYTLTKATTSIVYERSLIQKAQFPREALVLSIIFSNAFHFLVSLLLLCVFLIIPWLTSGFSAVDASLFWAKMSALLFVSVWLISFTSGISLLTAALNTKYRDVNFIVQGLLPLWFYASPIIYSLELMPIQLARASYLNPLTSMIEVLRWIFQAKSFFWLPGLGLSLGVSFLFIVVGVRYFKRESNFFVDWL